MTKHTSIRNHRSFLAAAVLAMITAISGPMTASAAFCGAVDARARDTYEDVFMFRAGQSRTVIVEGDHDTDLDCFLYDENGNEVDRDDDYTDTCVLGVTPRWTGEFSLVVVNYGHVYNAYCVEIL
jgi:hypothetical protein